MVDGVVLHLLGPGSHWWCYDGSHKCDSHGELLPNGTLDVPEDIVRDYLKREIKMEEGGV